MKISKNILFLFFISVNILSVKAQTEDEAVKLCLNNYLEGAFNGDVAKLNMAFHPSAILKSINKSGGIADLSVAKFVSGMPAGGMQSRGAVSSKIISYAYIANSALASVEIEFADSKFIDLLSMLKIGNEWKIVSRVFSQIPLSEQLKGLGISPSKSIVANALPKAAPKKSTANVKPKTDDGW